MATLLQNLPSLISSVDSHALDSYKFSFDSVTQGIMQNNFSSIDRMAISYDNPKYFKDFGEQLTNPTSISLLIQKLRQGKKEENTLVANYLERVAKTFSLDMASSDIVKLVWASNIVNNLGDKDPRMEELLSDLFLSLQFSSAYKDARITEARAHILEMFDNDMNEDLAESYFDINPQQAQNYLGVAYTTNSNAKDYTKWYDYKTFKEINSFDSVEIKNTEDLKKALASATVSGYKAACDYIKTNFLNSTDPKSARYCENDLVKEYKATIILTILTEQLKFGALDVNNAIGFNLLARIENLPILMAEKNPLIAVSNLIGEFKDQASGIATAILHEKESEQENTDTETTSTEEVPAEVDKSLNQEEYTKQQLSVFSKIVDKNRLELVDTLSRLVKCRERKSNFAKGEKALLSTAKKLGVTLVSEQEQPTAKTRYLQNVDLLIEAVNKRFDELGRAKEVFKKVRKKMGADLNIDDIEFNKAFLGKTSAIVSPYIEKLIKSFYKTIETDPLLKTNVKYRRKTPTLTIATMDERVKQDENASEEISTIFDSVKLTPSQTAKYQADKLLDEQFQAEQAELVDEQIELR